jgi:phosphatidylserine/phosphatidylglycerophosphate/cardiolipin synthase-like enzyme
MYTKILTLLVAGVLLIPAGHVTEAKFTKRPGFITTGFDGDCETLIANQLQSARRELLVATYIMTRPRIAGLIVTAHQRGVKVRVKYDVNQAKLDSMRAIIDDFEKRGIECVPITLKRSGASMHNKFIVIDGLRVITGSYNFTSMAESFNYENCLLIESQQTAQEFAAIFEAITDR